MMRKKKILEQRHQLYVIMKADEGLDEQDNEKTEAEYFLKLVEEVEQTYSTKVNKSKK